MLLHLYLNSTIYLAFATGLQTTADYLRICTNQPLEHFADTPIQFAHVARLHICINGWFTHLRTPSFSANAHTNYRILAKLNFSGIDSGLVLHPQIQ